MPDKRISGRKADRPRIDVVAAVIWRHGRFLAAQRPKGKDLAGYWEFPGGKVEPGETLEQALVREIQEELACTPRAFAFWRTLCHDYDHCLVTLHFFHVHDAAGEPSAQEGHALAWLTPDEAADYRFLPADTHVVASLPKDGPCV